MYDIGSFYEAASVEDAIRKLQEWPDAEIISGGSDVLIKIREGKLAGRSLVSIHNIAVLKGVIMEEDGTIVIGPGTSFSHITAHPLVQQHIPMLGYAVDQVGGPQIRNIGTIGGNVCNGVTSEMCIRDRDNGPGHRHRFSRPDSPSCISYRRIAACLEKTGQ